MDHMDLLSIINGYEYQLLKASLIDIEPIPG